MSAKMICRSCLLAALASLAGCAVGPDYQRPELTVPVQFKEAPGWKVAEPSDEMARGRWWERYGDAQLDALVSQVEVSNQNVAAAQAQYRRAQAVLGAARAAYYPTLSADFAATRAQSATGTSASSSTSAVVADSAIRNADRLSLSASWEADVWGRIGRTVEADTAAAQASAADLQAALLSAQATLVQSYLQLRVSDAQRRLLEETVAAYERSLQITRNRYAAGVAGRLDVAQAETQLKSAQAQAIDLGVQRTQLEHAIALLLGKAPADFALPSSETLPTLPEIPAGLPSALLERRPRRRRRRAPRRRGQCSDRCRAGRLLPGADLQCDRRLSEFEPVAVDDAAQPLLVGRSGAGTDAVRRRRANGAEGTGDRHL